MNKQIGESRLWRGARMLISRYIDHRVGRDSAALTYYLLFAMFPLLIFASNLLGFMDINTASLLTMLERFVPHEVVDVIGMYLDHVSQTASSTLLGFSLFFSVYFPLLATNCLMQSVRKAYGLGRPKNAVTNFLKTLIYTICLMVLLLLCLGTIILSRRVVGFIGQFVTLSPLFLEMWYQLRFIILALAIFLALAVLYALGREGRKPAQSIWPGTLLALIGWLIASVVFSYYVEVAGRYSLIYGSIGGIIVLLLWIHLAALMMIMGAEFNSVLLDLREEN